MPEIIKKFIESLEPPTKGNRVYYDKGHKKAVPGFGIRITAAGTRSFVVNYRTRGGRERRYTIGQYPIWSASAARDEAAEIKRKIRDGYDPVGALEAERRAPTMAELCQRYEDEHLPKKRPSSQKDDRSMIAREILPMMRNMKVADVSWGDVDRLHRKITKRGAPHRANRVVALLSKMFALAIRWKIRDDNPARGIERNPEEQRERYLTSAELSALTKALSEHEDQQAANIVRLLLLTGARRGEIQSMKWHALDLETGVWVKPSSHTKQKKVHRVPLSAPARQLLADLRAEADEDAEYVFPGRSGGHRDNIKRAWRELCIAAQIVTVTTEKDAKGRERVRVTPSARPHDLRHTYASVLASAGKSLPIIGALLGHTQTQTTKRYAHLFDDPLKEATERVGAIISPGTTEGAEVVSLRDKSA